jgi:hypothetical protein
LTGAPNGATNIRMGKLGGLGVAAIVATGLLTTTACRTSNIWVEGRVTQSPGCGVVLPDEPVCPDRPVAGQVQFLKADGTTASFSPTFRNGGYIVQVPPGAYVLHVDTGTGPWPHCEDTPVEVKSGVTVMHVDVVCGSGIR